MHQLFLYYRVCSVFRKEWLKNIETQDMIEANLLSHSMFFLKICCRIQRRFKLLLLLLLTMATLLAFWFAVSVYGYTSNNAINLFISLCLQYFFAFATFPLFFEAAVEVTYPVPEGNCYYDSYVTSILPKTR